MVANELPVELYKYLYLEVFWRLFGRPVAKYEHEKTENTIAALFIFFGLRRTAPPAL